MSPRGPEAEAWRGGSNRVGGRWLELRMNNRVKKSTAYPFQGLPPVQGLYNPQNLSLIHI